MKAVTYSNLRTNLPRLLDQVCTDSEPLVVTRQNDQPVVLISLNDYNSMEATLHLLRSPANAKRLLDSIKELDS